jgi:hypothetical protein
VVLRLLVLSPVAAILAIAGVALADEAGIVDPWDAGLSGWFGEPVADPAADIARINVEPRRGAAPSAVPGDQGIVIQPWGSAPLDLASDPWIPSARSRGTSTRAPLSASVKPRQHGNWAYVVDEIIDPWHRSGGGVARDPLIVDPWAR